MKGTAPVILSFDEVRRTGLRLNPCPVHCVMALEPR